MSDREWPPEILRLYSHLPTMGANDESYRLMLTLIHVGLVVDESDVVAALAKYDTDEDFDLVGVHVWFFTAKFAVHASTNVEGQREPDVRIIPWSALTGVSTSLANAFSREPRLVSLDLQLGEDSVTTKDWDRGHNVGHADGVDRRNRALLALVLEVLGTRR